LIQDIRWVLVSDLGEIWAAKDRFFDFKIFAYIACEFVYAFIAFRRENLDVENVIKTPNQLVKVKLSTH